MMNTNGLRWGPQGQSARPIWVKTTESPWDHSWDGDRDMCSETQDALESAQSFLWQRQRTVDTRAPSGTAVEQLLMTIAVTKQSSDQQQRIKHLLTCEC